MNIGDDREPEASDTSESDSLIDKAGNALESLFGGDAAGSVGTAGVPEHYRQDAGMGTPDLSEGAYTGSADSQALDYARGTSTDEANVFGPDVTTGTGSANRGIVADDVIERETVAGNGNPDQNLSPGAGDTSQDPY
jgi:hypothetical protein